MTIFNRVFHLVFTVEVAIAAAVFAAILFVLFLAVGRRRAGAEVSPSRRSKRNTLELSYLGVLFVIVAGLVTFTAAENHRELIPQGKVTRKITVTAYQWCWKFAYPGTGTSVDGDCRTGRLPTLVVPTGQDVELVLHSTDVIHAFWVPALKYKRDIFPHYTNTIMLHINRTGDWIGHCAEYCGLEHYLMKFHLKAVPPDQFNHWVHTAGHVTAGGTA